MAECSIALRQRGGYSVAMKTLKVYIARRSQHDNNWGLGVFVPEVGERLLSIHETFAECMGEALELYPSLEPSLTRHCNEYVAEVAD